MNKRAFSRQILHHPAHISSPRHEALPCTIKDFCKGGLFITFDYQASDLLGSDSAPFSKDDLAYVDFKSATLGIQYRLETRAVRVVDGAMGLSIAQDHPEAIHALYQLAKQNDGIEKQTASFGEPERQLVIRCRDLLHRYLDNCEESLFLRINDTLILEASNAESQDHQTAFFELIGNFNRHKERTSKAFIANTLAQIDNWAAGKPIALIESAEGTGNTAPAAARIEEWLVLKVSAVKAEQIHGALLEQLLKGFARLCSDRFNDSNNPFGPTYISNALYQALLPLNLNLDCLKAIFSAFNEEVILGLDSLYEDIGRQLLDGSTPDGADEDLAELPENLEIPAPEQIEEMAGDTPPIPVKQAKQTSAEIKPVKPRSTAANQAALEDLKSQQEKAKTAFANANNLIQLARAQKSEPKPSGNTGQPLRQCPPEEIAGYLHSLQLTGADSLTTGTPLTERVIQLFSEHGYAPDEAFADTLAKTQQLVDLMLSGGAFDHKVTPIVRLLEIPLLRMLQQNDDFFANQDHPARALINRLAQLTSTGSMQNKATERNILDLLHRITEKFDGGLNILETACQDLDQLMDRQKLVAQRNVDRVVESCEGLQAIETAKQRVAKIITDNIRTEWLPKLLSDLLQNGWRELMVFTLLRDGPDSIQWKSYALVVETLAQLTPHTILDEQMVAHIAAVFETIRAGAKDSPADQAQLDKIVNATEKLVQPGHSLPATEFIKADMAALAAENGAIATDADNGSIPETWLEQAKQLQPGDNLEQQQNNLPPTRVQLAWVGREHSKYVFVNQQGMKVCEFSQQEAAKALQQGLLQKTEDTLLPFVDQCLEQMDSGRLLQNDAEAQANALGKAM